MLFLLYALYLSPYLNFNNQHCYCYKVKPINLYLNRENVKGFEASYFVVCETLLPDLKPHPTNTRHSALKIFKNFGDDYKPLFGIEPLFGISNNL